MSSSSAVTKFNPVLLRQLKKADPESFQHATAVAWAKLLESINEHYRHLNADRALLARSMKLSAREMEELRQSVSLSAIS